VPEDAFRAGCLIEVEGAIADDGLQVLQAGSE
jgi:hypothetical protein